MPKKCALSAGMLLLVILLNPLWADLMADGGLERNGPTRDMPLDGYRESAIMDVADYEDGFVNDFAHAKKHSPFVRPGKVRKTRYHEFNQNLDISDGRTILSFWLNTDINSFPAHKPRRRGSAPAHSDRPLMIPPTAHSFSPLITPTNAGVNIVDPQSDQLIANLVSIGDKSLLGPSTTNGWQHYQFDLSDYTSLPELKLVFWLQTSARYPHLPPKFYFDDVTLTPEPAGLALLAAGVMALRKRQKSKRTP